MSSIGHDATRAAFLAQHPPVEDAYALVPRVIAEGCSKEDFAALVKADGDVRAAQNSVETHARGSTDRERALVAFGAAYDRRNDILNKIYYGTPGVVSAGAANAMEGERVGAAMTGAQCAIADYNRFVCAEREDLLTALRPVDLVRIINTIGPAFHVVFPQGVYLTPERESWDETPAVPNTLYAYHHFTSFDGNHETRIKELVKALVKTGGFAEVPVEVGYLDPNIS
jgi:hypothetical protein